MARLILSTAGISLLTNQAEPEIRTALVKAANVQTGLPEPLLEAAQNLAKEAARKLRRNNVHDNRILSAELNGLYGIYDEQLAQGRKDMHYIITTDTVLGRLAAEEVKTYLNERGLNANIYFPPHFASDTPQTFSQGIKTLIHWCEETIPGYREAGYEVIFNLTGGFKSLQGYLNIVGMFYADVITYIFESSQELLTIPRLPIRVDIAALHESRVSLALMAQGMILPASQVTKIPEGLLETDAKGMATLSDWGLLTWNRARAEILSQELLPFPRLGYTDAFRRAFNRASNGQRIDLQETLAKVAMLLEEHHGDTAILKRDPGLQYDNYTGKQTPQGDPIGHFRLNQGRRVSCVIDKEQLVLRNFGEHDQINSAP